MKVIKYNQIYILALVFLLISLSNPTPTLNDNRHRHLSADPGQSVISGTGTITFTQGDTVTVSVQAKLSSGVAMTTGGELFMVRVMNECVMSSSFYCVAVSGQRTVINTEISEVMTDHGDGTYSYDFTSDADGTLTISVSLLTSGVIYVEWWANKLWSGSPAYTEYVSGIDYDWPVGVDLYPGRNDAISAKFYYYLKAPVTGSINFSADVDDEMWGYCDGSMYMHGHYTNLPSGSVAMTLNRFYDCRIDYIEDGAYGNLTMYWAYPSHPKSIIPSNKYYYPVQVGSSPISVTSVCPTGYSGAPDYTECTLDCGNGKMNTGEACDDGNTDDSDGCASDCSTVEAGWVCDGGDANNADTCTECADGFIQNDPSDPTTCVTDCGDGLRAGSEICDDGNEDDNDGCANDCLSIEAGWACDDGTPTSQDNCVECADGFYPNHPTTPTDCVSDCGDGLRVGSEICDDGNEASGDGCASDCMSIEASWVCDGGDSSNEDDCEECTSGWYQNNPLNPTVCVSDCGDGFRVGTEVCDDGNEDDDDGCASDCMSIESSWVCDGGDANNPDNCQECTSGWHQNNPSNPTQCVTVCGDGFRAGLEVCDDGNDSDGCSSDCLSIEASWVCDGGSETTQDECTECTSGWYQNDPLTPTQCVTICGDGLRAGAEDCDDGNLEENDGCSSTCSVEYNWYCTGGNETHIDVCTQCNIGYIVVDNVCESVCGDEHKLVVEECDDGNLANFDGCSSQCAIENHFICTGGGIYESSICSECEYGYEPNKRKDECIPIQISSKAKAVGGTMVGLAGAGMAINSATAILLSSSPQSSFSGLNFIQLILLLPLIGPYLPSKVIEYIYSMNLCLFSFNFIPFKKIPIIRELLELIDSEQSNVFLYMIGLESGNSLLNFLRMLGGFALLPFIHILAASLFCCVRRTKEKNCIRRSTNKILIAMTFGAYIIAFFEMYLFIMLAVLSDFTSNKVNNWTDSLSLMLSIMFSVMCLLVCVLFIQQWIKSKTDKSLERFKYFKSLFSGLNETNCSRTFPFLFIGRRTIFCFLVIIFEFLPMKVKISLYFTIQLTYFITLLSIRPFEEAKDLLLETINEIVYSFLVGFLLHFNTEGRWNDTLADLYIYTILSNMLVVTILSLGFLIKAVIVKCYGNKNSASISVKSPRRLTQAERNRALEDNLNLEFRESNLHSSNIPHESDKTLISETPFKPQKIDQNKIKSSLVPPHLPKFRRNSDVTSLNDQPSDRFSNRLKTPSELLPKNPHNRGENIFNYYKGIAKKSKFSSHLNSHRSTDSHL